MTTSMRLITLFAALSTNIPVAAQATAEAPAPGGPDFRLGVVPIHDVEGREGTETWTATDTYKASFHDGMTFIPYLGDRAPENLPLRWRTLSVRAGETELLRADEAPRHWRTERRYEYRYGSLTEAYDVREDGLEQTFTLHGPLPGGDVVVTGELIGRLTGAPCCGVEQEILLRDPAGRPLVRYGAAWVVDAGGRRAPIETAHEGGVVRLTVPAHWLREARLPVTIDPLLSPELIAASLTTTLTSADVVYDRFADDVLVAFAAATSARDRDVFAKLYTADWSGGTIVFNDVTTADTPHVRVAVAGVPTMFCVAYEHQVGTVFLGRTLWVSRVRFHLHDGGDFALRTNVIEVPSPPGWHQWRPDVGGLDWPALGPDSLGTLFVLVYQRENSGNWFQNTPTSSIELGLLKARSTSNSTTLYRRPGPVTFQANDMERPSVNQSTIEDLGFPYAEWLVAWQERDSGNAGDDWNVAGRRLAAFGHDNPVLHPGGWVSTGGTIRSHHRMGPQVGGFHRRHVVAFSRSALADRPNAPADVLGHAVCAERVEWVASGPVNWPECEILSAPTAQLAVGGCGFDSQGRSHAAVSAHSERSAGGTGSVRIVRVGYAGCATETAVLEQHLAADQSEAGGVAFESTQRRWIATWSTRRTVPPHSVHANRFLYTTPDPVTVSGTSCSLGVISWNGIRQIGSEWETARLVNGGSNHLAALALALAPADVDLTGIGMPFCRQLVALTGPSHLTVLATSTDASGEARFDLPLPEYLPAFTLYLQWFHQAPGINPLGLVSTQRLVVPIAR